MRIVHRSSGMDAGSPFSVTQALVFQGKKSCASATVKADYVCPCVGRYNPGFVYCENLRGKQGRKPVAEPRAVHNPTTTRANDLLKSITQKQGKQVNPCARYRTTLLSSQRETSPTQSPPQKNSPQNRKIKHPAPRHRVNTHRGGIMLSPAIPPSPSWPIRVGRHVGWAHNDQG